MSAPTRTATAARRRPVPQRRRTAVRRRRRRLVGGILALGVAIVAIAAGAGLFQKAINDLTLPLAYPDIIRTEAAANRLPPSLVAAVIYAETKFDPRTSPAGAEGLMQIEPRTAEFLARRSGGTAFRVSDLATPSVNIAYGCYYLRYLLDEYGGNQVLALAAYNGGETNVNRWIVRARAAGHDLGVDDIPFPETRAYVEKVLQAQRDYRSKYAAALGYS